MKYIFISVFLFFLFEVPIHIKGYEYVNDNVTAFDYASNNIITYVSYKNNEYILNYKNENEEIEIIKTKSTISFPSIS